MTQTSRRFLPPEAIARISRLEVLARSVVEGFLSGLHRSPYFGQSVEFAQHREYAPGDDIRRIDWKVWSKTDRYYIKQYEEETNLRTTLLVDLSESMQFGSHALSKYEYACRIAASLSYMLLRQQDSVGMVTFDNVVRSTVPPSSKQNHLQAILTTLDIQKPAKKTDLQTLLAQVGFTVREPADAHLCCGSAGTYNVLQPHERGTPRELFDKIAATLVDAFVKRAETVYG